MKVDYLDHLALAVADVAAACRFYTEILGMEEITYEGGRKALLFGEQKINLHQQERAPTLRAKHPTPGSAELCFVTSVRLADFAKHLRTHRVEILEGPVIRAGAVGPIASLYFRDPDGNLLEVANYGHVS